ncbi:hypothetical protein [Nocardioides sp. P5_E3]
MKAPIFRGEKHIELGERPDPIIQDPTDAVGLSAVLAAHKLGASRIIVLSR